MKTEAEARQCWCPFVRVNPFGSITNRGDISTTTCIASECMAWRWANTIEPERIGYCGLAGKP